MFEFCFFTDLADSLSEIKIKGCEGEGVYLRCPFSTYIHITHAEFGRRLPSSIICPYKHLPQYRDKPFSAMNELTSCSAPNAKEVSSMKFNQCVTLCSVYLNKQCLCSETVWVEWNTSVPECSIPLRFLDIRYVHLFYIMLQNVESLCQERRVCRLKASVRAFYPDPCPDTGKYLKVSYKCIPGKHGASKV